MDNGKRYVVTIQRQFGSLGRPIAKKMAEMLDIEFYDRDIVEQTAAKLALPVSDIEKAEETDSPVEYNQFWRMMFPLGRGENETQEKIFEAQSNIIKFLAEKENCIIVGRCADFVLNDMDEILNIFIYAPYKERVKNCIEELNLTEEQAKKMCVEVDAAREAYQIKHAGFKAGDRYTEHIMIDSSVLGVDGTAEYLVEAVKRRFKLD